MELIDKILAVYPELSTHDFSEGSIILWDNADGNGAYIAKWEHPTLARPTDEQLEAAGQ